MREFQNGLVFEIQSSSSRDIWILALQKNGVFWTRLRGKLASYMTEMAPKRRFLKGFFCNFLGIDTHSFVKIGSKFENKSLIYAKLYEAWHEKVFRSQSSNIWGLGPKNYSRAIWTQSLSQRTYQAIIWEP